MAGVGRRRRRFHDRLAWIRRRTWPKQRGAKLRTSSSESDGSPDPVVKPVLHNGDAASKLTVKVGGNSSGDGNNCGLNTGTGEDVSYPPMLGCCSCNLIRKHLVAEEGGCEGTCARNLGSCDYCGSPKHVGHGRLRVDAKGQLYVLDSEAEDSELEESCRPVLRRGQWSFGRRLAATREVALEAGTSTATTVASGEMTEEMVHCMEQWLIGIDETSREVFIPWIKVLLTSTYTSK